MKNIRHMPFPERFHAQYVVDESSGCWNWTGARCRNGYGQTRLNYKQWKAHRLSYEMHKGPIPDGLHIDHLCRNPACVNPIHLDAVPPRENVRRGLNGVLKTHCKQGHPLSGDNLYLWRGGRCCKACRAVRWLKTPVRQRRMAARSDLDVPAMF